MNPYLVDILTQPEALRRLIDEFSPQNAADLRARLHAGEFDRLIISGMGSSYNAAYPAYLRLTQLSIPVLLVNSAELLHYLHGLIGSRTLLWLNSQSGRSAEVVHLLQKLSSKRPAALLACANDPASPLAAAADFCFPIHAGEEATVSTKTYVNMLAVNLLVAAWLLEEDLALLSAELEAAARALQGYLDDWQAHVQDLDNRLDGVENLMLLGRGASMSAVWNGSLINKEAAKVSFEGMQAADFRHGPLELAAPGFTALVFAGPAATASLNRGLALEIQSLGGRAFWIASEADPELPTLLLPQTSERVRPLVEILPMQMLTLLMAQRQGITAGKFRHVGKITSKE